VGHDDDAPLHHRGALARGRKTSISLGKSNCRTYFLLDVNERGERDARETKKVSPRTLCLVFKPSRPCLAYLARLACLAAGLLAQTEEKSGLS